MKENQTALDADQKEFAEKVIRLIGVKFDGKYEACWKHYADASSAIGSPQLSNLMADAGIGNILTRMFWVKAVMAEADTDKDGFITWQELEGLISPKE